MAKWFEQAFAATVDEARNAIADARAKLLDEAWFGRKTPEPHRSTDLGWTLSDRDKLQEPEPAAHQPEREQGIDR